MSDESSMSTPSPLSDCSTFVHAEEGGKTELKSESLDQSTISPPPDGGLRAWLVVLGTVLVSFSTFGIINAFGAFADFYKAVYLSDYPATLVSMIGALQVCINYIFAGLAGAILDSKGPEYMVPISGVVVTFAFFMLSITQPQQIWQQYLCQSVLFSVAASFSFFPCIAVLSQWFKRNLAFVMGFLASGASIGGIVIPIMFDHTLPTIGFGWSVRILAFISLVFFSIATLTVKSRRPRRPLPPLSRLLAFESFKNPVYTILVCGSWLNIFSIFNPFFYLGLYSNTVNPSSKLGPYYLAILCAASIVGRIAPALIADRYGRYNILAISSSLCAVLILAIWYTSTSEPSLIAMSLLFGITSGPFFSVTPACVAQITPPERVGAAIGMAYIFMSTGALAGTPLTALFIKDLTLENFRHLILFSGIVGVAGSLLIWTARFKLNRKLFIAV
ncbi:major facilitator superfamily domain-containing protein [Flagelloscypha sp. PMI_526]|nr:major facilitator superfamily domain-containing protein [Flagelloscypha sp. PMI_526]